MAEIKTKFTDEDVNQFIETFSNNDQKKLDSYKLVEIMRKVSGEEPKMWGPSIIGFGSYHYKYASGHEGDAPRLGFSPRKAAISLYVFSGLDKHRHLVDHLGKFTMGKACIYVKKLSDIDLNELEKVMIETLKWLEKTYDRN